MKKRWVMTGAAAIALAGGGWWLANQGESVPAVRLHREDVTATLTVTGEVRADTTVNFSPSVTAKITQVFVDEGAWVQQGQLLAQLDNAQQIEQLKQAQDQAKQAQAAYANVRQGTRPEQIAYQEQRLAEAEHRVVQANSALQAAQAQATDASRNAQRYQELFNQQLVSNQEYDNAQLQATIGHRQVEQRSAEAAAAKRQQAQITEQLREARKGPTNPELGQALAGAAAAQDNAKAVQADLTNHYRIVSSLNGIVVERLKDPGDLGRPGESILKVVNPQTLEVVCSVEENDLAKIHVGDDTYIVLDAMPEVALKGKIRRVGSQVNPDNGTVETRVVLLPSEWARFKTLKLLPGMTADVNVITGHLKQALVIPAAAVKNEGGRWYAFVFDQQKLVKREVRGERISMENFRVASGLQAGTWIAAVANEKLLDKKNVRPVAVTESAVPAAKPPARMMR